MPRKKRITRKKDSSSLWNADHSFNADDILILTGTANPQLARDVAAVLGAHIDEPVTQFADGEIRIDISHSMRHKDVYIIQPTSPPRINDYFMELMLMIDAATRASADTINAVMPYFGYARQDRKDRPRTSISAKVVADAIERVGAGRILTVDIHSEQTQGHVCIPWDNLWGDIVLVPELKKHIKSSRLTIVSPDSGGQERAEKYMSLLGANALSFVYKKRQKNIPNKSSAFMLAGDVKDSDVLLVDDMIDTAGTLKSAAQLLKKKGAKNIYAAATHGLFSNIKGKRDKTGLDRIESAPIEKVFVTDTIAPRDLVFKNKKVQIVSIAPLIAEAIRRTHIGESFNKGIIL